MAETWIFQTLKYVIYCTVYIDILFTENSFATTVIYKNWYKLNKRGKEKIYYKTTPTRLSVLH